MGSKVNPRAFRTTTTFQMPSRWFASKQEFAQTLQQDIGLRKLIKKKFRDGGVSRIEIERSLNDITIIIYTSKPGVVIGRGGVLIEEVKKTIKKQFFGSKKVKLNVNIQEVGDPEINAELIYQAIRDQIEQRIPFRRAMKRAIEQVMRAGAKGCRIRLSGRLNGAEIARTETMSQGRLPLHTLRANIDYSRGIAQTMYGVIGIKVWVYKGDVFGEEDLKEAPVKRKQHRPRTNRKQIATGGQKFILRKKSDVESTPAASAAAPASSQATS